MKKNNNKKELKKLQIDLKMRKGMISSTFCFISNTLFICKKFLPRLGGFVGGTHGGMKVCFSSFLPS